MSDVPPAQEVSEAPKPTSPLGSLLARREQIAQEEILPLRIPRWTQPEIVVFCKPLPVETYLAGRKRIAEAKEDQVGEISIDANADMLIKAAFSIEAKEPDAHWGGFGDPELMDALELQIRTARQACRKLFVVDADLIASSFHLAEWSGLVNQRIEEGFSGE